MPQAQTLPFRCLLITDEQSASRRGRSVIETLSLALQDVDVARHLGILVRAKFSTSEARRILLEEVLSLAEPRGATVWLHSDVELARRYPVAGVHIDGSTDPHKMRSTLPASLQLGASKHDGDVLNAYELSPLQYFTWSPIFRSTSKSDDLRPHLGVERLAEVARTSTRPVVALGGIDHRNAASCLQVGAAAVAVLGSVMEASNPGSELRSLLMAIAR